MFGEPKQLYHGLRLGEGPVWLARRRGLAFVDITEKKVILLQNEGRASRIFRMGDTVGCIVPTEDGKLLAALRNTLVELDPDTGETRQVFKLEQPDWLRFNDGKCDGQGRLWIGAMAKDQTHPEAHGGGSFSCVAKGALLFSQRGYTIPNGLAFRRDGRFYHTDTATGGIDLCIFSEDGGTLERVRVLNIPPEQGVPDGFCMDVDGNLWVALWGGGKVVCIRPETGEWLHTLALPDRNVSCCCFGGEDLATLYITTARDEEGLGGHLYAVSTRTRGEAPFTYRKD